MNNSCISIESSIKNLKSRSWRVSKVVLKVSQALVVHSVSMGHEARPHIYVV